MVAEIEIPEAAQEFRFRCGCDDPDCGREGYTAEALPLVVAAELRRQAAAFGGWHKDDVVRAHALRDLFLRRAAELDPQGGRS